MVGVVAQVQAQVNLGRVAVALARALRVEALHEMVHGLIVHTQDVSSLFC